MKVLKIFLAILIVCVVGIVGYGYTLPAEYRVERTLEISAPPVQVFNVVNDFKTWDAWSPWVANDPTVKTTVSGPENGVGATSSWASENSGSGSQTITISESPSRIETALDFGEMGKATSDWQFSKTDSGYGRIDSSVKCMFQAGELDPW